MTLASTTRRHLKLTAVIYLAGMAWINFIMSSLDGSPYWTDIAFLFLATIPLITDQNTIVLICGVVMCLVWSFFFFALSMNLLRYMGGQPYSTPCILFAFGYPFILTNITLSGLLILLRKDSLWQRSLYQGLP